MLIRIEVGIDETVWNGSDRKRKFRRLLTSAVMTEAARIADECDLSLARVQSVNAKKSGARS